MTIQEYMTTVGQTFWSSLSVSLFIGIAEWVVFLFFVQKCADDIFYEKKNWLYHGLALAAILVLGLRHYPVHLHTLLLLIITSAYICLLTRCSWFNGVLEGTYYCLILELGKSACRDGLLAYGVSRLFPGMSALRLNLALLLLYFLFLIALCLLFRSRRHRLLNLEITTLQAVGLLYPLFLYLAVRYGQYAFMDELSNLGWLLLDLLNYALAICVLLNLSATESMLAAQAQQSEIRQRQLLMEQKQLQYQQQSQAIEDINRRYHDLKHYLQAFETMFSRGETEEKGKNSETRAKKEREQTEEFLRQIRREIDPYSQIRQTGNAVMDVLLSQRMQECESKHIRLLPYVDARQIGFISTVDLCTLFGNAMDNAIEATQTLPDTELKEETEREITVRIGVSDQLLLMRFHNAYEGQRKETSAGFQTTKVSAYGHGYGLKSIAHIANRYGGTISTDCREHEFTLHILIPLPNEQDSAMSA